MNSSDETFGEMNAIVPPNRPASVARRRGCSSLPGSAVVRRYGDPEPARHPFDRAVHTVLQRRDHPLDIAADVERVRQRELHDREPRRHRDIG